MSRFSYFLIHFFQVLFFAVLVVFSYLGYQTVQDKMAVLAEDLKYDVIESLEETLGYRIGYDQISPSVLTYFEIRNLQLVHPVTKDVVLKVRSLKLFYNPFALIFQNTDRVLISGISLNGLDLSINAERDRRLIDLFTAQDREQASAEPLDISRYFAGRVRIRSVDLQYEDPSYSFQFNGRTITVRQQKDFLRVIMAGDVDFSLPGLSGPLEEGSFSFSIKGSLFNNLTGFNLDGDFREIRSNLLEMDRQRMNIRYSAGELRLAKIRDDQPYDLNLVLSEERIQADFSAEQFSFNNILTLRGGLAFADPWLNTVLSGSSRVVYFQKTGDISYEYDGSAYLRNETLPFPVHTDIRLKGNAEILQVENLTASTPKGHYTYSGEWVLKEDFPRGQLDFYQVPLTPGVTAEGRLSLSLVDDYFYIQSDSVSLDSGWKSGPLQILLNREGDTFVFSLRSSLNTEKSSRDQIFVNGEFLYRDQPEFSAEFRVDKLSFDVVKPFFPEYAGNLDLMDEGLSLTVRGSARYQGELLSSSVELFQISDRTEERSLKFRGYFSPEEMEIFALEANWNGNYLLGNITGVIGQENIDLQSNWNINDNLYLVNGIYSEGKFSLLGSFGLKGQFLRNPGSGFLATLESKDFPIRWDGNDLSASLNIRGRYSDREWEVYLNESSVEWKNSPFLSEPEMTLTAYLAPGVVNIFSLQYRDGYSTLGGSGSLFYNLEQNILNGSVNLTSRDRSITETYSLYCVYNDGSISSSVTLDNALLDRLESLGITGRIDAEITLEGSLEAPELEGTLSTGNLTINGSSLNTNLAFRMNPEKIELYDLKLQRNTVTLSKGLGFLNFQEGTAMLTASVENVTNPGEENQTSIQSGITFSMELEEPVGFRELGTLGQRDFTGRVRFHPVRWNGLTTFSSKTVNISKKDSVFSGDLIGDPEQNFMVDLESKKISARVSDPFPVRFQVDGSVRSEDLDLNIQGLELDLNLINYFMPKDKALDSRYAVFRENSSLVGNLHLGGTSRNPSFSGHLDSRNLMVLTPYTVDDIGMTDIRVHFQEQSIRVDPFTIPIGEGGLSGSGFMNLSGWGIKNYELLAQAGGVPGTPVSYNGYGVLVDGAFTGNIRLYGTDQQGGLEGRFVLNEMIGSIGARTEIREKSGGAVRYPFTLDLEFLTGRNVQFILPNPQLEIVKATAEPGESIQLQLDTRNGSLVMDGEISIRNGEINYFDRTFRMTEGSLTFNETEEDFNPFLNLEAEIDTTDINGDDVTVFLTYRNPIRDEFSPSFRTDPPRSEDQIMALFGQSLVPYNTDEVDLSTLVLATGGMVSDMGLTDPFENALEETLNLDSVTIETEILENALIEQLSSYEGYSGTESSYNLGRYLDNTSIYLGQFIGDYLLFSAGLLVDYNELDGINSYSGGMSLVPDLTLEMRTPFFLVSWNYNQENAPDFNTDFVPRNAISLEWRYSY